MNKPKRYFVTAIGTGCGKTVVSAILTEYLKADYWKPVQSGTEDIDRETVQKLVTPNQGVFYPERYLLKAPMSPHASAALEGIDIKLSDFQVPETENHLIIEGAGGILVPLNYKGDMVIDLAKTFGSEVILVSNYYLGSINHTLLTVQELKRRNIPIKGLVFNGDKNEASERIILEYTGLEKLFEIETTTEMTSEWIKRVVSNLYLV